MQTKQQHLANRDAGLDVTPHIAVEPQVIYVYPEPAAIEHYATYPIQGHSPTPASILRPRGFFVAISQMELFPWLLAPAGITLFCFYLWFFTLAHLDVQVTEAALMAGIAGIVLGFPARALALHILSKVAGGYPTYGSLLLLSACAALPLALRHVVETAYMLATRQALLYPGLSGLTAPTSAYGAPNSFQHQLLAQIDLYQLWTLVLLVPAVSIGARLLPRWSILVVAIYGTGMILLNGLIGMNW